MRPFRFTADSAGEAAVKAAARSKLVERFALLEEMLHETGPFSLGDHFTAVDAYVFVWWGFAHRLSDIDLSGQGKHPKWARVVRHVEELPAVQATLKAEADMRTAAGY
jgi:glutathione S-transferase